VRRRHARPAFLDVFALDDLIIFVLPGFFHFRSSA
jgi:hypothetical protein